MEGVKIMKTMILILFLALSTFLSLSGCSNSDPNLPNSKQNNNQNPEAAAKEIVQLLKEKNIETLSEYIHPSKGVRFSPYGYINEEKDRIMNSKQIVGAMEDQTTYVWGHFDGSGEPINMTFEEYFNRFVYDEDYLNAEKVAVNERLGQGNSLDNSKDVYPEGTVVEFHFPGFEEKYEGMDWRSLRLVMEKVEDNWVLVGIIHDEWTT